MSLRLSACSTMPCQLFSSEVFSSELFSEVLGEVRCSATAILFSRVSRRCFVRDMSEHDPSGKPVPTFPAPPSRSSCRGAEAWRDQRDCHHAPSLPWSARGGDAAILSACHNV